VSGVISACGRYVTGLGSLVPNQRGRGPQRCLLTVVRRGFAVPNGENAIGRRALRVTTASRGDIAGLGSLVPNQCHRGPQRCGCAVTRREYAIGRRLSRVTSAGRRHVAGLGSAVPNKRGCSSYRCIFAVAGCCRSVRRREDAIPDRQVGVTSTGRRSITSLGSLVPNQRCCGPHRCFLAVVRRGCAIPRCSSRITSTGRRHVAGLGSLIANQGGRGPQCRFFTVARRGCAVRRREAVIAYRLFRINSACGDEIAGLGRLVPNQRCRVTLLRRAIQVIRRSRTTSSGLNLVRGGRFVIHGA